MKIQLTEDQERAKNLIAEWYVNTDDQIFVLSGYAGTGKTFLVDYIVRKVLMLKIGSEAVFVSPTGKAAANLVKKGTLAGTVHGLIYIRDEEDFDVDENGEIIKQDYKPIIHCMSVDRMEWYKSTFNDPNCDIILYDEFIDDSYEESPEEFISPSKDTFSHHSIRPPERRKL